MSDPAHEILEAGIRDAKTALMAVQGFDAQWRLFAEACQTLQLDVAAIHAEKLVALVETATDLYLTSHRRMAQFDRLTAGDEE